MRGHSDKLGLQFRAPESRARANRSPPPPGVIERRLRLREPEDSLIRELAAAGWFSGMAAIELDLDQAGLWRHSRRLGVTSTRYGGRSVCGQAVAGMSELLRLRATVRRERVRRPG